MPDSTHNNGSRTLVVESIVEYQEVEAGPENKNRVDAAFDILFEAVFRQEELQRSAQPEISTESIDNKVHLGVSCLHGVSH